MKENISGLLSRYDLGNFVNLYWAEGGFTNENYIVETSTDKFFLKKYLRTTEERINREHKLLEYLKKESFPVPKLIPNNNNRTLTEYNGDFYTFFEFIRGYTRVATNNVSEVEIKNIAKTLAHYHHLAKHIPMDIEPLIPIINRNYLEDLYHQINGILQNKKDLDDFDRKIAAVLDKKTEELKNAADINYRFLPSLFIHGDFHAANLKFHEDGEVAAVFDWELAKYQPRIWEVLCAMVFCTKKEWTWNFHTAIDFSRAKQFLLTYNQINPLTPEEVEAIPPILKSASADLTWPLREHYIHNNFISDRFLPINAENWFFWNDQNIEKLKALATEILSTQTKLL